MNGRGRRPGSPDTREAILAAARAAFAAHGFARTTIRAVARDAGVDPALVHHYFGSKDGLFAAAVELPVNPVEVLAPVAAVPPGERGAAAVRALLGVWDSPGGAGALALFRSAVADPERMAMIREFVVGRALGVLTAGLGLSPAERARRTALAGSQLAGLIVTRYVMRVEPIASAPAEELVAAVGAAVQRYLTGPVPGAQRYGGLD